LTELFKSHMVDKTYLCLCKGVTEESGSVEARLKVIDNHQSYKVVVHHQGKEALTHYSRLKVLYLKGDASEPCLAEVCSPNPGPNPDPNPDPNTNANANANTNPNGRHILF